MSPQQPLERRWGDFEAPSRVPNLWLVLKPFGPRAQRVGFVPVPNGDLATTNFAFGGPDNREKALQSRRLG